jgi:glycine cleavage system regulatory protein
MQTSLVLTILGSDCPGLVKSLSDILNGHQASWSKSRMVHLSGKFAGLLQVSLASEQLAPLTLALKTLEEQGLQVIVEQTEADVEADAPTQILTLQILGQDRQGIIHDISRQLDALQVNIEELESELRSAPMSGEALFYAQLVLSLPSTVPPEKVQETLEAMSDQFMVDLEFD